MKGNSKKVILVEILLLAVLLITFGIGKYNKSNTNNKEELTVTFFDVGKGDCILVETTKGAIMIDTGYEENGDDIVKSLNEKGVDTLDYLILTHPDKDHIGGADIIINNINVKKIIETNCSVDSEDYLQYKQAAQNKKIDCLTLTSTKEISIGDTQLTIYPPLNSNYEGQNDYSLVTKMIYGKTDFLFAADAEETRIDEILRQIPNIKSMLLKVPHHGIMKKNSQELFETVSSKYSIITCDKKKMYEDVTKMLQNLNSEVFTTKGGDIIVKSDGNNMFVSQ